MAARLPAGDVVLKPEGSETALTASVVRYGSHIELRIVRAGRWVLGTIQLPRSESAALRDGLSDLIATMPPEAP